MYAFTILDHESLRTARLHTTVMTAAIFAAMVIVLYLCASLVVGCDAPLVGVAVAVFLLLATTTPPVGLVMRLTRAVPVARYEAPELYADLAELARRAGLDSCPTLWWLKVSGINAFAAGGRDSAGIAVSTGALRALSRQELVAVLAHEVAHIAAGDTRLMTVGSVLIRITHVFAVLGLLASMVLLVLTGDPEAAPMGLVVFLSLATPAVALLYLALSRNREFAADLTAARLTGDALGLARALEHLERVRQENGVRHPLLCTHPATRERVNRLLGTVRLVPTHPAVLYD